MLLDKGCDYYNRPGCDYAIKDQNMTVARQALTTRESVAPSTRPPPPSPPKAKQVAP